MRRNTNEAATGTTYSTTKHPNAKRKIIEKRIFGYLFTFDSIYFILHFSLSSPAMVNFHKFLFYFHQFLDSKNENKNKMSTLLRTRYASELNWRTALVFWYIVWLWLWLCACVLCMVVECRVRRTQRMSHFSSWQLVRVDSKYFFSFFFFFITWVYVYILTVSRNWKGDFELKRNQWPIRNERFHRSSNENWIESPMKNWFFLFNQKVSNRNLICDSIWVWTMFVVERVSSWNEY